VHECFLIVDECHRSASKENSRALEGVFSATLGLSATPKRDYDFGLEEILIPRLGNIIFEYDYIQAKKDGVITDFDLINVKTNLLGDEQSEYDRISKSIASNMKYLKDGSGTRVEIVKRLLQRRARIAATATMRIPVALKLVDGHKNEQVIIFHEDVKAADKIYKLLLEIERKPVLYHYRVNPVVRRDNLRLYRRGLFDTLVTCRALDEGLNVPETAVAVIASSTASVRQRIQRLGRVLRTSRNKKKALVYTIYATALEERRLTKEGNLLSEVAKISWKRSVI